MNDKETFHFVYHKEDERKRPDGYSLSGLGVYLHGLLEDEAGYDIPWASSDFLNIPDGVYPATFNGQEGATLFLTRRSYELPHIQLRGLVVWNHDPEFKETENDFWKGENFFKFYEYKRPAMFVNIS